MGRGEFGNFGECCSRLAHHEFDTKKKNVHFSRIMEDLRRILNLEGVKADLKKTAVVFKRPITGNISKPEVVSSGLPTSSELCEPLNSPLGQDFQ